MNDFTKEELEYFVAIMKPFHFLWQEDPLVLEAKLQHMIENYCCACPIEHIYCDKCGRCLK